MTITKVRERINYEYRKAKKALMKKELQHQFTPTEEIKDEMNDLKGYMRGMMKCLGWVEGYQNGAELPFDEAASDSRG